MQLKTLMFAMFFGLLSATIMTGCSEKKGDSQEKTQDKVQDKVQEKIHGHSH